MNNETQRKIASLTDDTTLLVIAREIDRIRNSLLQSNIQARNMVGGLSKQLDEIQLQKGDPGYTPVKGLDYFDGKDGYTPIKGVDYVDGIDGYTPRKGVDYFDGKPGYSPVKGVDYFDGTTPVIDTDKLVSEIVSYIVEKKILEAKHIKGLPRNMPLDMNDLRWHGGGLSSVSHDSSLTGSGTSSSPLSVVSSGSFTGAQETSNTAPDGITQTFNFTNTPTIIYWNGAFQTLTDDYTVSGNDITFTASAGTPLTGDKVVNVY